MVKTLRTYLPLLLLVTLFTLPELADAQCAMCKATAESASESIDESIGEGLNRGIIYLMAIPYVLLILGGLVFFRKKIVKFYKELGHAHQA